jgi:acyl carrier protein
MDGQEGVRFEATVLRAIVDIISEMLEDWGTGGGVVSGTTMLVADLEFASVDIIHLIVAIEEHFGRGRLNFQDLLMKDNRYVDDLSVNQLASFVTSRLS